VNPPGPHPSPAHRLTPTSADGPVVVLAHGLEDGWQTWYPLARRLDPAWRVYALQLPWHAGAGYAWRRTATPGGWLDAALRGLPAPVDVVVGHSFGANAVLEALATVPDPAMSGAVLVAPFYCPPELRITWAVYERARHDFNEIIRQGLELRLGARMASLEPSIVDSMLVKTADRIGPVGFTTLFDRFLATADLPLAAVTVPTLVVTGGRDPSLDDYRAAALRRELPDAHVVVEPGFDHFCQVLQVEAVARHVAGFVEKTCVGRGGAG
jgi:pimeloyl-ACP methyl ester carboxylesterase